jgi:murein DD-endopeptidase MepM/ murein hydrolase activator NlpD
LIKGVRTKTGYRRAAAGVMGCLLASSALGTSLAQGTSVPVSAPAETPPAASEASRAWEPAFDGTGAPGQTIHVAQRPSRRPPATEGVRPDDGLAVVAHVVLPGESLWTLADTYDTDPDTLLALNTHVQPEALQPGQTLRVLRNFHGISYRVEEGDTVGQIALAYGIDPEEIKSVNGLDAEGSIRIDQVIFLPGARPRSRNQVASRGGMVRREEPTRVAPAPAPAPQQEPATNADYLWPLSDGRFFSEYGYRNDGFHSGLDIAVPEGTPAVASRAGTVVFAGWSNGYGNLVVIDHGDGVQTKYAHASAILVTVGEEITASQQVILVGSTGRSTGPHLHFEVVVNGTAKNPRSFLP